LNDGFWARRFGRSPDVLGKTITVRQATLTVIGVAPRGFFGETVGSTPDFWVPISMQLQVVPGRDWLHVQPNPIQKVQWLHVFGRLQPGYTLAQVQTEVNVILKRNLEESYASLSAEQKRQFMDQRIRARPAAEGASELRGEVQQPLFVIFAAVGTVLLICCVNVANLLLARANSRRREVMVRLALGANKFRIVRQLMTESLIISVLGACGGLFFAQSGAQLLLRMASDPKNPIQVDITLDGRVLAFTLGIALLTTLLFGLAPAFRAARTGIGTALREGAGGMTQSAGRLFLSKSFVVAQVALSLTLVVGAGLFLRTLMNLKSMDLGYPRERLLTMRLDGAAAGYKDKQLVALYSRIREALASAPGVNEATYSENGLLSTTDSEDDVEAEGYPKRGKDAESTRWDEVAPGYFATVRIPILLGREISERDKPGMPLACVINQTFAKHFFAGRNPIGRHITTVYGDSRTTFEVVGVAKDSRDHGLRGKLHPRFFSALQQAAPEVPESAYFEVRTNAEPGAELLSLRRVIQNVGPNVAILSARSVDDLLEDRVRNDSLVARLTSVFGGIALLLAAIGIYGVLAYAVSQRTTEIGIRMAIGAQAGTVVRMVLKENGLMLLAGLGIGLLLSFGVTRLISSQLVGVEAADPAVFLSSVAIILALGTAAGYGAASRAARIDPIRALRNE
jgi:predicted permease